MPRPLRVWSVELLGLLLVLIAVACDGMGRASSSETPPARVAAPVFGAGIAAFEAGDDGFITSSAMGGVRARFDATGRVHMQLSTDLSTPFGMKFAGMHRGSVMVGEAGRPRARLDDNTLRFERDGVTEWYRILPRGLEQGFDIALRPTGDGELRVRIAFEGNVELAASGQRLDLLDGRGRILGHYGELVVTDRMGTQLPTHLAPRDDGTVDLVVDDAGAAYPIVVDPLVWALVAEYTAPGIEPLGFGRFLDRSSNTLAVGMNGDATYGTSAGAVDVFVEDGMGSYTKEARLFPPRPAANTGMGRAVAVDGDTLVTGWAGSVLVFTRTNQQWSLQQELVSDEPLSGDFFGLAVAVQGDTIIVGARGSGFSQQGSAYVFRRDTQNNWYKEARLFAYDGGGGDDFGEAVALDGNTAVIRGPGLYPMVRGSGGIWSAQTKISIQPDDFCIVGDTIYAGLPYVSAPAIDSGEVREYVRSMGTWSLQATITPFDPVSNKRFGTRLDIKGNHMAVTTDVGEVYFFARDQFGAWLQRDKHVSTGAIGDVAVAASNAAAIGVLEGWSGVVEVHEGDAQLFYSLATTLSQEFDSYDDDRMGASVAAGPGVVVVGAPTHDEGIGVFAEDGHAFIYEELEPSGWVRTKRLLPGALDAGRFGSAVAYSQGRVAVGAPFGEGGRGRVAIYEKDLLGEWQLTTSFRLTSWDYSDDFGASLAMDWPYLWVGAPADDDNGNDAGAVYLFVDDGMGNWTETFKLLAPDGGADDDFGTSIAADGSYLAVGAPGDVNGTDDGSVYLFKTDGMGGWPLHQKVVAIDGGGEFGSTVDLSGDTLAVAAYQGEGRYTFRPDTNEFWLQRAQFTPTQKERGVAIEGDLLLIPGQLSNGQVDILRRDAMGVWSLEGRVALTCSVMGTGAISGNTVVVGSPYCNGSIQNRGGFAILGYGSSLGSTCATNAECTTGHCVDGVCCDNPCGGGDPGDCLACSNALTGGSDGQCQAALMGTVCRPSVAVCDGAETCDGISTGCPADTVLSTAFQCRGSLGPCDPPENCDGVTTACPADAKEPSTTVCRASIDLCDSAEFCDGVNDGCPADAAEPATTECRPSAGGCDPAEFCDGTDTACPTDALATAGAPGEPSCAPYVCDGQSVLCPSNCLSSAECESGKFCDAGACVDLRQNGAFCATDPECGSGFCVDGVCCDQACGGGADTDCEACVGALTGSDNGTCAPLTAGTQCADASGQCGAPAQCDGVSSACPTNVAAPDGTACDDGDACTDSDTCQSGVCRGGTFLCGTGGAGGATQDGPNASGDHDGGDDAGGCSCVVVGTPHGGPDQAWWTLLFGGALARRRRRPAPTSH